MFPHVARCADEVNASLCTDFDEGEPRLRLLRPVLRMFGLAAGQANLCNEQAIDSIGKYLHPLKAELYCVGIMSQSADDGCRPRAWLSRSSHTLLTAQETDNLAEEERARVVPVRGTSCVAREVPVECRELGEVHVQFDGGGSLLVRRAMTLRITISCISLMGIRKVLTADLPAASQHCIDRLFQQTCRDAVVPRMTSQRIVNTSEGSSYDMPLWFSEIMACLGQDLFRLQVITTAAASKPNITRPFQVDRVTFHCFKKPAKSLLQAVLHPVSGTCICPAHQRPEHAKSKVVFSVSACGSRVTGNCSGRHFIAPPSENADFGGFCDRELRCTLRCVHSNQDQEALKGIELVLPVGRCRESLSGLLGCARTLCDSMTNDHASVTQGARLESKLSACIAKLQRARLISPHRADEDEDKDKDKDTAEDEAAVYLLRMGGVSASTNKSGKVSLARRVDGGERLTAKNKDLAKTHGHLFVGAGTGTVKRKR
jgi:hypothetical protein